MVNYCNDANPYARSVGTYNYEPMSYDFPIRVLQYIYDFCYISRDKFLVVGKATSGIGSTVPGVIAIWHWHQGINKPPLETVLDRSNHYMRIKNCEKTHSVFLRNASGAKDYMLYYAVYENFF